MRTPTAAAGGPAATAAGRDPPAAPLLATAAASVLRLRADGSGTTPRRRGCVASGSAVHVGGGLFLTAAHLVDGHAFADRGCPAGGGPPALALAGFEEEREAPARLLRTGQGELVAGLGLRYRGGADAAALLGGQATGDGAAPPAVRLCAADPRPEQRVLVVTAAPAARPSRVTGTAREEDPAFGAYVEIEAALDPGASGGAVLDVATGCLLGLVSHREERADASPASGSAATRIVPASTLRAFLPS